MEPRTLIRQSRRVALLAGGLLSLGGCATGFGLGADRVQFERLRSDYILTVIELHPVTAMYLGRNAVEGPPNGITGKLRDYSPEAIARERAFFRDILQKRDAIRPERLRPRDIPEYLALGRQVSYILQQLETSRYYERAVSTYVAEPTLGVRWQLEAMTAEEGGLRGTEAQWRMVLERISETPGYLESARGNLLAGKSRGNLPDWEVVETDGIYESRATADYFRGVFMDLARRSIGDRAFGAELLPELERAANRAATAFDTFATFLQQTYDVGARQEFVSAPATDRANPGGLAVLYR